MSRIKLDANGARIQGLYALLEMKRITFNGGVTDAIGDHDGALDPFVIFTVTGDVVCQVFAVVRTSVVGATSTIEVGVAGATSEILNQIDATLLVASKAWYIDNFPSFAKTKDAERKTIIGGGLDIMGTVGTANITAGVVDFYCFWYPLSEDGRVIAA